VRSGLPAEFRHAATPVAGAYGSTVGLVSLGAIGRRVARLLAENHEVRLLVHDPHLPDGEASAHHAEPASLPDVFSRSDVVSIHTPWLPETEKMVGADLVLSMKPGATLLNTSRGAVIDEDGLCEALRLRPDITAILDVTHPEPPAPDSALRSLPNVFLTPHIAGSTGPEVARMGRWMLEEARRHLAGEPLRHRIDPDRLALMA
jgi:phosphoglycerate dehydrogenase-like enzyme